jgi:hypothetical protein
VRPVGFELDRVAGADRTALSADLDPDATGHSLLCKSRFEEADTCAVPRWRQPLLSALGVTHG